MLCSGQTIGEVTIIVYYCVNDNIFKLVVLDVSTFSVVCAPYVVGCRGLRESAHSYGLGKFDGLDFKLYTTIRKESC